MLDSEDVEKIILRNVKSSALRHNVVSQNVRFMSKTAYKASIVAKITEFMKSS